MIRVVIAAVVTAIVLPAAVFTIYTTPIPTTVPSEPIFLAARAIDFPVAAFNRLLPESLRTHMTLSLQCSHTYCFPPPMHIERANYQLVGTAAYLVLFALGAAAFTAMRN